MNKVIAFAFGLLSVAVVHSTAAAAETAGGACVNESARKELSVCPGGGPKEFDVGKHGNQPHVSFRGVAPIDGKKKGEIKPGAPTETIPRDDRKSRLQARARALLVTEIQGLENLFGSTPRNSPDRVELARRLSEDYVELESAAFKEKITAEIDRDTLKKTNPAAAGQKQTVANDATRILNGARAKAQTYYALIKNEYPNYSKLDEVLYYLAYEYEQASDNANARKVYLELINKRPDSKYVPNAYLAFGELFFNEAMGDPSKWDLAAQAYTEVIKYPPEKNKVYGYAWYKLGYVFWNQAHFEKALNAFKKTIDWGNTYKEQPGASKLADAARKDTIPVYALKGDPAAAYNYFHNISGDTPGSNEKTYLMMDALGINYLDTGHYPEAITLYRDLMSRDRNGDKHCLYQAHITEATLAMKASQKDAVKAELDNQLKNYNEFKNANHPAEAKKECSNKTAALVTETGMAWHLEAVGSQGQRGTGDQKAMTLAAYLYKKIADTWSAQDFQSFEFPRIVKEDWPTIYKIRYAMADLLYFQQKWAECGPAFDAVVAENPTAAEAPEAAYASVLCYQNIYESTHKGGEDRKGMGNLPGQKKQSAEAKKAEEDARLQPKALTDNQKGMITAFNRYICYIKPAPGDKTGEEQMVEVKYARARTYFEAQHWEEAAAAFREIAMTNSDKDVGIYAAQLYLESINVIGSHMNPPRPSCYDDMNTDVPKFVELYCTGEKEKKNAEQCVSLTKIQCDIQRLKAQKLVELADKGGQSAVQTYEQAGNTYIELWRRYGEGPLSQGQPGQCERLDEILYNSAKAFQAARLIGKAIKARTTLLDPRYKMEKTDLAKKATYEIGGNLQAIAVYDQAADWFERYAKENPKYEKADLALSDATILRLGLGDEEAAIKDAEMFRKNYGASKPTQAAAIAFAIGAHYAEKEEWEKAQKALEGSIGYIDRSAAPDIQAQGHATLARSYTKVRHQNKDRAKVEFARVRSIWANSAEAVRKIKDAYPGEDDAQKQKRIGKALNAVGEAYFYAAEELKKEEVDKVKFPTYHGSGSKEDVLRHVNTKVKDWLEKKKPAIDKAAAEYKKIVDLQPDAPPKWVIAAGSRVGLMWGDFVDSFRKSPIPDAWRKTELEAVYYDALDGQSEPIKVQRAKPALVTCLSYSVKFQYFDDYSRQCEVWLAKNYKAEYHVVDELRGAPTLSNSGLDDKAPPLTLGGQIWHPPATGPAEKVAASSVAASTDDGNAANKKGGGDKAAAGKGGGKAGAATPAAAPKPPKGAAVKPLPGQKKK